MAKAETKKTVTLVQIKSPPRREGSQQATLIGLGLNKLNRRVDARGHAGGARHDRQGCASHPHRRSGVMGQVKMDQRP